MSNERYTLFKYTESGGEKLTDVKVTRFLFDKVLTKKLIYNALVCEFKHKVYYIEDKKGLIHYSMSIGKCKKFPFLKKNDYILGPSWTRDDARGQKLLAKMLNYISAEILKEHPDANIYTVVREENVASIKGVLKSDFKKIGYVEKTPRLKIYSQVHYD